MARHAGKVEMEFQEAVRARQSVRVYADRMVEEAKLTAILEAANRAPSAGNFQAYEIYVVRGQAKRQALMESTFDQKFVGQAPVSLVFCTHAGRCEYPSPETWALEDATIACTFAMLAATDLGLATCWVGAFSPDLATKVIGAPEGVTPMAILPIGYAGETPERTSRRALRELVHEG